MADFWQSARELAQEDGPKGRQRVLAFPSWDRARDQRYFLRVLEHINDCSDVCEWLGESLLVAGIPWP